MSLEESVIAALRLEGAAVVDRAEGWELWKYKVRDPASQTSLPDDFLLLFINSKGLEGRPGADLEIVKLRNLRIRLRDPSHGGTAQCSCAALQPICQEPGTRST